MTVYCLYVFGEVGLVTGLVRRGRVIVGMCSARSALCRDLFGEVWLMSRRVRRGRLSIRMCSAMLVIVGTCPAKSA